MYVSDCCVFLFSFQLIPSSTHTSVFTSGSKLVTPFSLGYMPGILSPTNLFNNFSYLFTLNDFNWGHFFVSSTRGVH